MVIKTKTISVVSVILLLVMVLAPSTVFAADTVSAGEECIEIRTPLVMTPVDTDSALAKGVIGELVLSFYPAYKEVTARVEVYTIDPTDLINSCSASFSFHGQVSGNRSGYEQYGFGQWFNHITVGHDSPVVIDPSTMLPGAAYCDVSGTANLFSGSYGFNASAGPMPIY